ncbi:hypothetical protein D3C84_1062150 [compost metagenome]
MVAKVNFEPGGLIEIPASGANSTGTSVAPPNPGRYMAAAVVRLDELATESSLRPKKLLP